MKKQTYFSALGVLLLLVYQSSHAGDVHAALGQLVPEQFRGVWGVDLNSCRLGHEGRMEIHSDKVEYYESSGPLLAVVSRGSAEVAWIAELSGEGDTWISLSHWSLSQDRKKLSSLLEQSDRIRCPN